MQPYLNSPTKKLLAGASLAAFALAAVSLLWPADVRLDPVEMRLLSVNGTIKTVQGDGSRALHVFLSTDCSFCRQIEPELAELENVTVYRHLLPGHTEAGRVTTTEVLCSEAPAQAWSNVAAGKPAGLAVRMQGCDVGVLKKNLDAAHRLGVASTPTVIYANGKVSAGLLSSAELAKMLAEASAPGS